MLNLILYRLNDRWFKTAGSNVFFFFKDLELNKIKGT